MSSSDDADVDAAHGQGLQIGSGNTQHNHFHRAQPPVWPHRVGVVPPVAAGRLDRPVDRRLEGSLTGGGDRGPKCQIVVGLGGRPAGSERDASQSPHRALTKNAVSKKDARDAAQTLRRLSLVSIAAHQWSTRKSTHAIVRSHALLQRAVRESTPKKDRNALVGPADARCSCSPGEVSA